MRSKAIEVVASEVLLGLLLPEDIPGAACELMEGGYDSPSLRILAGLTRAEDSDARPLLERALAELNVPAPSIRDAVLCLARETAKDILIGTVPPYQGAKRIWEISLRSPGAHLPELDSFVYAASEWEDRPEDRRIFEDGIVAAAGRLLGSAS